MIFEHDAMANGFCITGNNLRLQMEFSIVVTKVNTWQIQSLRLLSKIVKVVLLESTPINTTLILVVKIVNLVCTHRSRRNWGAIYGQRVAKALMLWGVHS